MLVGSLLLIGLLAVLVIAFIVQVRKYRKGDAPPKRDVSVKPAPLRKDEPERIAVQQPDKPEQQPDEPEQQPDEPKKPSTKEIEAVSKAGFEPIIVERFGPNYMEEASICKTPRGSIWKVDYMYLQTDTPVIIELKNSSRSLNNALHQVNSYMTESYYRKLLSGPSVGIATNGEEWLVRRYSDGVPQEDWRRFMSLEEFDQHGGVELGKENT